MMGVQEEAAKERNSVIELLVNSYYLDGGLETGTRNVIPDINKPERGFHVAGKLLCIQKAAVLAHKRHVSAHVVPCKTGSECETPSLASALQLLSSRVSPPHMMGIPCVRVGDSKPCSLEILQ